MSGHGIGGVPVVDRENVVIGIVSRRDVRAIVNRRGAESIRAIMTPSPITTDESCTMEAALETMYTNKVERLPVTDSGGHLIGIITMQDVLEKRQYPRAVRDRDGNLRVAAAVGGPFATTTAQWPLSRPARTRWWLTAPTATTLQRGRDGRRRHEAAIGHGRGGRRQHRDARGRRPRRTIEAVRRTQSRWGSGRARSARRAMVAGVGCAAGVGDLRLRAGVAEPGGRARDLRRRRASGSSGDVAKAIAAGADSVMARLRSSPGRTRRPGEVDPRSGG